MFSKSYHYYSFTFNFSVGLKFFILKLLSVFIKCRFYIELNGFKKLIKRQNQDFLFFNNFKTLKLIHILFLK